MTIATPSPVLYTATATAFGGREGRVASDDGILELQVVPPKTMGGKGGATNPEQLFAAGYSACFGSAVAHVARSQKLVTGPVEITAKVGIGPITRADGGQGFGLTVALEAKIPELSREQAEALVNTAHQVCPYSNATRGNVPVTVTVV
ncbi:MAG: organic hydroperoxide resistance protein [Deltaproteobacteria bacterium]|nr:organic hydroperoxide resistance protein [Deltaproteobacteria bacterium]